jgi:thiol-disulfide isomerase/thioredoxin
MMKTLLAFFIAATVLIATKTAIGADTVPAPLPRPAGEFTIHLDNGKQVLLSSYRGKVVLLAFFFTTCSHCQHMAGVLQGVEKEYAPKGVQVLSGCFDDNAQAQVGQFNEMFVKNAFPVGWDPREAVLQFLHLPSTTQVFVPIITFIDRAGKLQQQYIGDETYLRDPEKNVRASLDQLLKPAAVVSHAKTTKTGK